MPEALSLLSPEAPAGTPPAGEAPAGTPLAGEAPAGTPLAGETPEQIAAAAAQKAIDDAAKTAPETYTFKMPDGIEMDKDAVAEFSAIAKELKLPQDQAQRVAEVGAKMVQRQQAQQAALVASWVEASIADKDIGGDKLPENMAIARKAVATYGSPELNDALEQSGFKNHPAFVKAFYKIGLTLKQDAIVPGGNATVDADPAKKLFPNLK